MAQEYFDFTNDLIFRWVMEREEMIREHLKSVIPEVKKRAQDAAIYLNKMIQ